MLYCQKVFTGSSPKPFSPLSILGKRFKLALLVAFTLTVLLGSSTPTVHAQAEDEIIGPPQELPFPPPAPSPAMRAVLLKPAEAPLDLVAIGSNFQGSELFFDSFFIPPDTMGAVGFDHIVQMINGRLNMYNKSTEALVFSNTLDEFWTNVVGLSIPTDTFDPRIVFDPASGRWFAASIDRGSGNNIYLGRSDTGNPTGGWDGVRFPADTVGVAEFHDYDTFV